MSAAVEAQRIRKAVERWPEVRAVYGPSLGKRDQFFMRYVTEDGKAYSIELCADGEG